MLYQEGWGVGRIKHSLTYSGGLSRSYARTYAPARQFGFEGFSPFTRPNVIEVAEGIPFIALTDYSVDRLYALRRNRRARHQGPHPARHGRVSKASIPARGHRQITTPRPRSREGEIELRREFLDLPIVHTAAYPEEPAARRRWIEERRGPRNALDPARPHAFFVEEECSGSGEVVPILTVFLTNRECPWRCLMCDLWKNALTESVAPGMIPAQIETMLCR